MSVQNSCVPCLHTCSVCVWHGGASHAWAELLDRLELRSARGWLRVVAAGCSAPGAAWSNGISLFHLFYPGEMSFLWLIIIIIIFLI